jgi:hypothetical protein
VHSYLVLYLGTIPVAAPTPGDVKAMFTAVTRDETVLGRPGVSIPREPIFRQCVKKSPENPISVIADKSSGSAGQPRL